MPCWLEMPPNSMLFLLDMIVVKRMRVLNFEKMPSVNSKFVNCTRIFLYKVPCEFFEKRAGIILIFYILMYEGELYSVGLGLGLVWCNN